MVHPLRGISSLPMQSAKGKVLCKACWATWLSRAAVRCCERCTGAKIGSRDEECTRSTFTATLLMATASRLGLCGRTPQSCPVVFFVVNGWIIGTHFSRESTYRNVLSWQYDSEQLSPLSCPHNTTVVTLVITVSKTVHVTYRSIFKFKQQSSFKPNLTTSDINANPNSDCSTTREENDGVEHPTLPTPLPLFHS